MSTLIYCCGFECGIANSNGSHLALSSGNTTFDTTTVRSGSRSLRMHNAPAVCYTPNFTASAYKVLRAYVQFTTLPSADTYVFGIFCGDVAGAFYKASDGKIYAAAGNQDLDACGYSPAQILNAITVGATTDTDVRAGFSNFGPCVDLYAPGLFITSASIADDTSFAVKSGTSQASPHVAGIAALYLELYPAAKPAEVADAIVLNSTPFVDGSLVYSLF